MSRFLVNNSTIEADAMSWLKTAGYVFDNNLSPDGSVHINTNCEFKGDIKATMFQIMGENRIDAIRDFSIVPQKGHLASHLITFEFTTRGGK